MPDPGVIAVALWFVLVSLHLLRQYRAGDLSGPDE